MLNVACPLFNSSSASLSMFLLWNTLIFNRFFNIPLSFSLLFYSGLQFKFSLFFLICPSISSFFLLSFSPKQNGSASGTKAVTRNERKCKERCLKRVYREERRLVSKHQNMLIDIKFWIFEDYRYQKNKKEEKSSAVRKYERKSCWSRKGGPLLYQFCSETN